MFRIFVHFSFKLNYLHKMKLLKHFKHLKCRRDEFLFFLILNIKQLLYLKLTLEYIDDIHQLLKITRFCLCIYQEEQLLIQHEHAV